MVQVTHKCSSLKDTDLSACSSGHQTPSNMGPPGLTSRCGQAGSFWKLRGESVSCLCSFSRPHCYPFLAAPSSTFTPAPVQLPTVTSPSPTASSAHKDPVRTLDPPPPDSPASPPISGPGLEHICRGPFATKVTYSQVRGFGRGCPWGLPQAATR